MGNIAIRIGLNSPFSKCAGPLRKHTGLGIKEINSKIKNNDFLAETNANDIDNMEDLKELVDNLLKLGADVKIFDSDQYSEGIFNYQKITYEEFIHNINRLNEIMEELQDQDDAISDEA